MNVLLDSKWEQFVHDRVGSGRFNTATAVLEEGLRLLEERERLSSISITSLADLEAKIIAGLESSEHEGTIKGDEAFADLRGRIGQRNQRG